MAVIRLSHLADADRDGIRDYIAQHSPAAIKPLNTPMRYIRTNGSSLLAALRPVATC